MNELEAAEIILKGDSLTSCTGCRASSGSGCNRCAGTGYIYRREWVDACWLLNLPLKRVDVKTIDFQVADQIKKTNGT